MNAWETIWPIVKNRILVAKETLTRCAWRFSIYSSESFWHRFSCYEIKPGIRHLMRCSTSFGDNSLIECEKVCRVVFEIWSVYFIPNLINFSNPNTPKRKVNPNYFSNLIYLTDLWTKCLQKFQYKIRPKYSDNLYRLIFSKIILLKHFLRTKKCLLTQKLPDPWLSNPKVSKSKKKQNPINSNKPQILVFILSLK